LLYYYDIVQFSIYRTCIILLLAGKSLQSGHHPQCVLALILNKQEIDTQSTAISLKQRIGGGGRFVNIYLLA